MTSLHRFSLLLLALLALPSGAVADDAKADKTHQAALEPLRVLLELPGVFESTRMSEVVVHPHAWAGPGKSWHVVSAVPAGTEVRRHQTLIEFDTSRIEKSIQNLERSLERKQLELTDKNMSLKQLSEGKSRELETNERQFKQAREDLEHFLTIEKPLLEKQQNFALKAAEFRLEYDLHQLRQLEKMYAGDDMTEESEEIVLMRTRFSVERTRFALKQAQEKHKRYFEVDLPRREQNVREATAKARQAYERAVFNIPHRISQIEGQIHQTRSEIEQTQESLEDLKADFEQMTVTSPADGIVYYGPCKDGHFTAAAGIAGRLRPHGNVNPGEVVMTIVDPKSLVIRTTIPEESLADIKHGLTGVAIPKGDSSQRLAAKLNDIDVIPQTPGKFGALANVTLEGSSAAPLPGQTCTLRFVVDYKAEALMIPNKYLDNGGSNPDRWTVTLTSGETRVVTLGRRLKDKSEVVSGLEAGQSLVLPR